MSDLVDKVECKAAHLSDWFTFIYLGCHGHSKLQDMDVRVESRVYSDASTRDYFLERVFCFLM